MAFNYSGLFFSYAEFPFLYSRLSHSSAQKQWMCTYSNWGPNFGAGSGSGVVIMMGNRIPRCPNCSWKLIVQGPKGPPRGLNTVMGHPGDLLLTT